MLLIDPVVTLDSTYEESINAITAAESVPPPLVNAPAGNLAESIVPVAIAEAGKGLLFILILPVTLTPESVVSNFSLSLCYSSTLPPLVILASCALSAPFLKLILLPFNISEPEPLVCST